MIYDLFSNLLEPIINDIAPSPPTFLELLFSKKSMAGAWAVIGALIALTGIILNNYWENRRKKKDREHELIREGYFGAVEYINHFTFKILTISQQGVIETTASDSVASEKYYKLFLIAPPEVINAITTLSSKIGDAIIELTRVVTDVQHVTAQKQEYNNAIQNSLRIMEEINQDRKEYNDKKENIPSLLRLYDEQYEKAQMDYSLYTKEVGITVKKEFELKIALIKKGIELMNTLYPDIYEAIFIMRNGLDQKLNKKDSQALQASINALVEQLTEKSARHIEELRLQIIQLLESETS
ncbi:MAG: hypothetical protein ACRBCK_10185 [Alphaproteobacteria bacterium]